MRDSRPAGLLTSTPFWPLVVMPAGLALVILALTGCEEPKPPTPRECNKYPFGEPRDPETLPACCPQYGGAHCLPADALPDGYDEQVEECAGGGYCLPDIFISTGGTHKPQACTSLNGAPGACLSGCLPDVGAYFNVLPQDVCGPQERCAPCTNPIDNMPSGACDLGGEQVCDGPDAGAPPPPPPPGDAGPCKNHSGPPVIDPTTLPPCTAGAHCLDRGLIPDKDEPDLNACDGSTLCVPDELIASGGNYTPKTCDSIGGVEGRCLSLAIPKIAAQKTLPQDTCAATHRCAPCHDPFTGEDTGACRVGCDPGPTPPADVFPSCCSDNGRCAPASVAGERASSLGKDTCAEPGDVCIPLEYADPAYKAPSCDSWFGTFDAKYRPGVCLSSCIPEVASTPLLFQDNCALPSQRCVPCIKPNTSEPSGACTP